MNMQSADNYQAVCV